MIVGTREHSYFVIEEEVKGQTRLHFVGQISFSIGRSQEADLSIKENGISRVHCLIWIDQGQIFIEDQGSKNGTKIDNILIESTRAYKISSGQKIQLGTDKVVKLTLGLLGQNLVETEKLKVNDLIVEPQNFIEKNELPDSQIIFDSSLPQIPQTETPLQSEKTINFNQELNQPVFDKQELEKIRREKQEILKQAQEQAKKIRSLAEKEIEKSKQSLLEEIHLKRKETEESCNILLKQSEIKGREIQKNSQQRAQDTIEEARRIYTDLKNEMFNEKNKFEMNIKKLVQESELKKNELSNLNEEIKEVKNSIDQRLNQINEIESEFQSLKSKSEIENEKLKLKSQKLNEEIEDLEYTLEKREIDFRNLSLNFEKKNIELNNLEEKLLLVVQEQKNSMILKNDAKKEYESLITKNAEINSNIDKTIDELKAVRNEKEILISDFSNYLDEFETVIFQSHAEASEDLENLKNNANEFINQKYLDIETEIEGEIEKWEADLVSRQEMFEIIKSQFETDKQKFNEETELIRKKIIEDSEKQAELVIKNAERWARDQFDNSKRLAEQELERIREEKSNLLTVSQQKLEQLKSEMMQLKSTTEQECSQLVIDTKKMIDNELTESKRKSEELLNEAQAKSEYILKNSQRDADELLNNTSERVKSELNELESKKQKINLELDKIRVESELISNAMLDQANVDKEKILTEAREVLIRAEEKKQELLSEGNIYLENKKQESEHLFLTTKHELEQLREKMLTEAQEEAGHIISNVKSESEKLKNKEIHEINLLKARQLDDLNKNLKEQEQDFFSAQKREVDHIVDSVEQTVLLMLKKTIQKELDLDDQEELSSELRTIVKSTLLGESVFGEEELNEYMINRRRQRKKVKRLVKRWSPALVTAISMIFIWMIYPELYENAGTKIRKIASDDVSMHDRYIQNIQSERNSRPVYEPVKTDEFKNSYVENVLFTSHFIEYKSNTEYQNEWIRQLNEYFVDQLKLSDTSIVNFVSRETTLIKDLQSAMQNINPNLVNDGIKKLEEIESDAIIDFKQILGGNLKFKKFKEFERRFYQDWQNIRAR